jgi:pimeloyl-ACP methyl ester carboxylesterase
VIGWVIRSIYQVPDHAEEVHQTRTADGWRIALSRYLAHDGAPTPADAGLRRHPVLIIPGLAANRFSVDLSPDASLPQYLSGRGFDCWVMETRGNGRSESPSFLGNRSYDWCVDEYCRQDLPAAIDAIRRITGAKRVHLIGHSLGGIMSFGYLGCGDPGAVKSVTSIGASLDYCVAPSDYEVALPFTFLGATLPAIPIGPVATLLAPLGARGPSRFDEFNIWYPNVEPAMYRRLQAISFHIVPSAVLVQLAGSFEKGGGGLRTRDRRTKYLDLMAGVDVPVMAVAGARDRQCPPAAAEDTLLRAGRGPRTLLVFGKSHGQQEDYAHFDLLMGKRAHLEVYPGLAGFLEAHD